MYAIFRAAGFQYRAEPGLTLKLPTLEAEPGQQVEFEEVLLGASEDEVVVGRPLVPGAKVVAQVVRHGRGDKLIVWKFRRRENYRRKQGHRRGFTEVRVRAVDLGNGRRSEEGVEGAPKKARVAKKAAKKAAPRKKAAKKGVKRAAAKAKGSQPAGGPKKRTRKKQAEE